MKPELWPLHHKVYTRRGLVTALGAVSFCKVECSNRRGCVFYFFLFGFGFFSLFTRLPFCPPQDDMVISFFFSRCHILIYLPENSIRLSSKLRTLIR